MATQYGLPMCLYKAIVSMLGENGSVGHANVNFDTFVEALHTIGFRTDARTNAMFVVMNASAVLAFNNNGLLDFRRPAAAGEWWPYEQQDIAMTLENKFKLSSSMFIGFNGELTDGAAIIIA